MFVATEACTYTSQLESSGSPKDPEACLLALLILARRSCRGLVHPSNLFRFYAAFTPGRCGLAHVDWLTLLRAARCVLARGGLLLSFRLLTALSFRYVFGAALFFSVELFRYICTDFVQSGSVPNRSRAALSSVPSHFHICFNTDVRTSPSEGLNTSSV